MKRLTKAQKALLLKAFRYGSVATGGFGSAQHHRPAWTLTAYGLLRFAWVPVPPVSFVLGFLGVPAGARLSGLLCQGWTLSKAGRRAAQLLLA